MTGTPPDDGSVARRKWVAPVAGPAVAAAGTALARAGFSDATLLLHWEAIVGAETARLARPLRLSEGPHGGVLTLLAEPAAAVFLSHETRSLCERINTYLGRPAVARLRFVQGSLTQRPVAPARPPTSGEIAPDDPVLKYDGPEGLREALWRLARARRSQG